MLIALRDIGFVCIWLCYAYKGKRAAVIWVITIMIT